MWPSVNLIQVFPFLVGISFTVFFIVVLYVFWYRPRTQMPLSNEQPWGRLSIYLPKGIGLHEGYSCGARATIQRQFTQLIKSETDGAIKKKLEATRTTFDGFHPVAHKVGRQTFIYLFDLNPRDQKFMDVNPNENDSYIIHDVKDVESVGDWNGKKFLGVKLNPETKKFSPEEKKWVNNSLEVVKYLRDAAKNVEKIHGLKEERDYYRDDRDKERIEKAKIRSERDRGVSALGQKPLTVPAEAKIPGGWKIKVKEWFSPVQLLTGALAYFSAPHLQIWLKLQLEPPFTTYFAALITVVGFFIIPIGKKLFGR